jgi:hypothetical protein
VPMRRVWIVLFGLTLAVTAHSQDTVVYRHPGSSLYEAIASAISSENTTAGNPALAATVDVTSDGAKDLKEVKDASGKPVKYVYAIGPDASSLASNERSLWGIYLFVPNPYAMGLSVRPNWAGVSPYPDPQALFAYLKANFQFTRVAVLYTKKSNQDMAKIFERGAAAENVTPLLVGVNEPGELQGALVPALKSVDAVLLLMDPLAFSPESLRFILSAGMSERKPVVGMLESMAASGTPLVLSVPPVELAKTAVAAMQALRQKGDDRKILFPQRFVMSVNDEALKGFGLTVPAAKVSKHY